MIDESQCKTLNSPEFPRHPAGSVFALSQTLLVTATVSKMFALRVIEHLGVVKDILPRVISGFVSSAFDTLAFEKVEGLR
jgi:uncharacterized membrane protein